MDRISPEKRSWNMSRIKSKNTTPERIVRSFLHENGFRFRLHSKILPGSPDIVLPKYKTVIEVRGCFWHRHPGCRQSTTPTTNVRILAGEIQPECREGQEHGKTIERAWMEADCYLAMRVENRWIS